MNVLESLKQKADRDEAKLAADWESLIVRVANDEASEIEVAKTLKATDKSITDLEAAVHRHREIVRLQAEVAAFPERVAEHQRRHREHIALKTQKRIREFIGQAEAEDRKLRTASYTAAQAVDRSRDAATKLGRLLGREVSLPPIEPDAVPEAALTDAVTQVATDAELHPPKVTSFAVALPSDA